MFLTSKITLTLRFLFSGWSHNLQHGSITKQPTYHKVWDSAHYLLCCPETCSHVQRLYWLQEFSQSQWQCKAWGQLQDSWSLTTRINKQGSYNKLFLQHGQGGPQTIIRPIARVIWMFKEHFENKCSMYKPVNYSHHPCHAFLLFEKTTKRLTLHLVLISWS